MLGTVDVWLLRRAERFAHWTQDWFGITSYRWVQVCMAILALSTFCDVANYFFPVPVFTPTPLYFLFLAPYWFWVAHCVWGHCQRAQADWRVGTRAPRQPPNVLRWEMWMRVSFVWMAALAVGSIGADMVWTDTLTIYRAFQHCRVLALGASAYLILVHPRPFQRGRVLVPIFGTR